ncbi:MAG: radical SAM protein [Candidatus Omnitrophota bacterium]|nr:radical SAM protein [Candidatus Omnitrophota bacterium]
MDNALFTNITLHSLEDGYPVLYPPPLIWSNVSKDEIIKSWKNVARNLKRDPRLNKICLYIHIPFCQTKCVYCNCVSFPLSSFSQLDTYLGALKKEIDSFHSLFRGIKFSSLYIGGGTPTVLRNQQIADLIQYIKGKFCFEDYFLFAIDAHPNSLDSGKLRLLKDLGLKRLTIGVETLDKKVLVKMARKQTRDSVYRAFTQAREIGIPYLNIDLMAGLPGQTIQSFVKSLLMVVKLHPDIIHVNPFLPDKNTLFSRKNFKFTQRDIRRRKMMVDIKRNILEKFSGYKSIGRAGSALSKEAINPQINLFESPDFKVSILGLGYGAISYAFANRCYRLSTGINNYFKSAQLYNGYKMNRDEESRYYIIKFLYQGINKRKFFKLFGVDFNPAFKKEISFLKRNLNCLDSSLIFRPNFKDKKQYFILSKIFYSKKVMNIFKSKYSVAKSRINDIEHQDLDAYIEEE